MMERFPANVTIYLWIYDKPFERHCKDFVKNNFADLITFMRDEIMCAVNKNKHIHIFEYYKEDLIVIKVHI